MKASRRSTILRGVALTLSLALLKPSTVRGQAAGWLHHVSVLANDSMRGRETGSREHHLAALYIARRFREAGLKPAGEDGFLQRVSFVAHQPVEDSSLVELVRGDKVDTLRFGTDITLNVRAPLAPAITAPLAFAGYGLFVLERAVDDLSGLDIRGKIVVVMSGGPAAIAGPILSNAQSVRWLELRKRGAVGVITIGEITADIPPERAHATRPQPGMVLLDTTLDERRGQLFSASITPELAQRLFSGSGYTYARLRGDAAAGRALPRFDIPGTLRARVKMSSWQVVSENVAGMLRGSDPALASEYVVLTAHLDHIGVGLPVSGDSIFNGALDNASGVATLIETARAVARRRPRPRRSIIFLAVTGEEKGLLGSRYFAAHPTVPDRAIVADANTDMLTPFFPLRKVIVNGIEESDLAGDVRRAAASHRLEAVPDPEPERNAFIRSDQYSFIKRGIPSISLKIGFDLKSPEHEAVKKFRAQRYHGVGDDLSQGLDLQAVEDFNGFYADLVREIANRRTRPAWNQDSYFRPKTAKGN